MSNEELGPMDKILKMLAHEQDEQLSDTDITVALNTGEHITGIIESTADGVLSIRRHTGSFYDGGRRPQTYADIPRHYRMDAVIGAYYTDGS